MILSGKAISQRIGSDIHIDPYDPDRLNPNSYNLRLHNELLVYDDPFLDIKQPAATSQILIPDTGYTLQLNKLHLGRTVD